MAVFKRHGKWYIDYWYEGKRIRECIGINKVLARKAFEVRKAEIVQGKFNLNMIKHKISLFDLCNKYLDYIRSYKKAPQSDENSIKNLKAIFKNKHLNLITPLLIEDYKILRSKTVKPATINREMACLRYMYNLAIKWEFTNSNPMKEVKLYQENNERVRFLSAEEEKKLISCCAEHLKPIVIFALNTGCRRGEIFNLKWQNLDFTNRLITVEDTKNGDPRKIPMNDTVHNLLLELNNKRVSDYVFPNFQGGRYTSIKRSFSTALKKAGITDFRFHDTRHSFSSNLIMSGVDLVTVKELLGHKSIRMTLRYSHLRSSHKLSAVQKLT